MAFILGLDTKLYYGIAGAAEAEGTPAAGDEWLELTNMKDLSLSLETATDDVSTRGGNGWRQTVATLKDGTTEFEMIYDPADAGFIAFNNAFFVVAKRVIGVYVADGDESVSGTAGLMADFMITSYGITQNLEEASKVSVTIQPTFSAFTPAWTVRP